MLANVAQTEMGCENARDAERYVMVPPRLGAKKEQGSQSIMKPRRGTSANDGGFRSMRNSPSLTFWDYASSSIRQSMTWR